MNAVGNKLPLRLLLRFSDQEFENRFVDFYANFHYRFAQWSLGLGLFLLLADFLADWFAYPRVAANFDRLLLCSPFLAVMLALTFLPRTKRYWELAMSVTIVVIALMLFQILLAVDLQGGQGLKSWVGILNFAILELYCFVILGVRFAYALVCGVFIFIGFEFVMVDAFGKRPADIAYLTYHVATMTMVAGAIGWWREFLLRKDFVARSTLEEIRMSAERSAHEAEYASQRREYAISLMEATLDATDNGILVVDRAGKVVSANQRFAKMWRVPDELIASGDDEKILAHVLDQIENPEHFMRKVDSLYAKPEAASRDTVTFRDGRTFARFSHPQTVHGEVVGRVWSFLDISDQRRADQRVLQLSEAITEELERSEQQRRQLQTLLSAIPDLVWMKDPDGRFLSCNPAFEKLLGAPEPDILGKTDLDFFSPEIAEAFREHDLAAAECTEPQVNEEWVTYASDGHRALLNTVKAAVRGIDGQLIGVLGVARDVTRAHALFQELELARRDAQQSSEAKSVFLASMSHELRTPLNAIIGFAQILEMGVPVPLDPSQKEAVGHILGSGRHLHALINEVLDLARVESGRLDLAIADMELEPTLEEAVAIIRPAAAARQIVVRHSCPKGIVVRADAIRLRQVFLNLLSNAVKYNREGGMVAVSCVMKAEAVRITVVDTGAGIPEDRRALLFQPFQRLGAERTATEGTGIGLVISKKLTEAMHGRIGFESEVGVGSRFWLDLPVVGVP